MDPVFHESGRPSSRNGVTNSKAPSGDFPIAQADGLWLVKTLAPRIIEKLKAD